MEAELQPRGPGGPCPSLESLRWRGRERERYKGYALVGQDVYRRSYF